MTSQVTDRPRRLLLLPTSLSTMILYLLFPLLITGILESQAANMTVEEWSKVEGNQTYSVSTKYNSTIIPGNATSSFYNDEKSQIEEELQNNQTSTVITEDDENFQDQEREFPHRHCRQDILVNISHGICGANFHSEMLTISRENWCLLESITRPYSSMTSCLENLCQMVDCYYPNPDIQDFFLYIHSYYFHNCTKEDLPFEDAPHELVMALTLIPVSLIPILVYLVVWKSKVQE
ncbi:receptor activity-modifying protein 1-like [Xiphias gladius]|uniref:receptor activity-modifying protein 1-like n=1 Tax=Xiphias gladius TaxID=8245 RepID=UPI001A99264E|nr:receptor activity-modifying protein 1-like [Xiphias gladius]